MPLALYLSNSSRGGVCGECGRKGAYPDVEGLFRGHGFVDEGKDGLHPLAADFQPVVAVPAAGLGKTARHPVGETAAPVVALPPFAGLVAEVAFFAEHLRDGGVPIDMGNQRLAERVVFDRLLLRIGQGRRGVVPAGQVLVDIESGGQRHQGRAAQGGGHVAALEDGAARGEGVEMRRLDEFVPHKAVVGPRLVVGQNEDDVRRRVGGARGGRRGENAGNTGGEGEKTGDVLHRATNLAAGPPVKSRSAPRAIWLPFRWGRRPAQTHE